MIIRGGEYLAGLSFPVASFRFFAAFAAKSLPAEAKRIEREHSPADRMHHSFRIWQLLQDFRPEPRHRNQEKMVRNDFPYF
jgi:hypothetical protein